MAYPLSALVAAGYSACDLLQAAFTPQQLRSEHVQLHDIIAALPLAHYALHAGYCYRCVRAGAAGAGRAAVSVTAHEMT